METYSLQVEPQKEVYRQILDCALSECQLALLVVRPGEPSSLSPRGCDVLTQLTPFITKAIDSSEWPGTRLYDHTARVYYFAYNSASATVLKNSSTRLYQWVQPEMPEDLCLLRSEQDPWLASIAHERDAYFVLDESGYRKVVETIPGLAKMLHKDHT